MSRTTGKGFSKSGGEGEDRGYSWLGTHVCIPIKGHGTRADRAVAVTSNGPASRQTRAPKGAQPAVYRCGRREDGRRSPNGRTTSAVPGELRRAPHRRRRRGIQATRSEESPVRDEERRYGRTRRSSQLECDPVGVHHSSLVRVERTVCGYRHWLLN